MTFFSTHNVKMKFGLGDTFSVVIALVVMVVLFYSYLIQSLALSKKKKVTDYPFGHLIQDSNTLITLAAGVGVLVLAYALGDDLFGKGNFKSKLYPTNTSLPTI